MEYHSRCVTRCDLENLPAIASRAVGQARSRATVLAWWALLTLSAPLIWVPYVSAQSGTTARVSLAMGGGQANGPSADPVISADGRFVAFSSFASNLVPGDTNNKGDIFVYDRQARQTTRVSIATDGRQGRESSTAPAISADGRYVAYSSFASELVPGDTNGKPDIFVRDPQTGQTTRVSVGYQGAQAFGGNSTAPAISADGRHVAFASEAINLLLDAADSNGKSDIFVHDRYSGKPTSPSSIAPGIQPPILQRGMDGGQPTEPLPGTSSPSEPSGGTKPE